MVDGRLLYGATPGTLELLRGAAARPPRDGRRGLPARTCRLTHALAAYLVLRRTFEQGAFTDRAFHAAAVGLRGRDRALAMRLAYGSVQRALTLDQLIERASGRPVAKIDAPLLAALRLGSYELCFAGNAQHAVVNDAVELAKGFHGHGLVNAVLRRLAREGPDMLAGLRDEDPRAASIRHSMPLWIVELWWDALGAQSTRELLARTNEPAENSLRANTLRTDAVRLAASLSAGGVDAEAVGDPPEAVVVSGGFDAHGSAPWRAGELMPQSRASMLVAHCVSPSGGERVLDLCAAPGGKTTHLAALMGGARRDRRGRAPRRTGSRAAAHGRAHGGGRGQRRDRRRDGAPARRRAVRTGPARCPLFGARDAPVAPRPALARDARGGACARRAAGPAIVRGGRRVCAGSYARLLDVHDLAGRERAPDRSLP